MNERIRQLADEAGLRFTQLMSNPMVPVVDGRETDLAKFAQLIIDHATECVRDVLRDEDSDLNYAAAGQVQNRIKQFFGVEDRAVPILSADEQALFAGIASSKLFTIAGAKKQFGVEE